MYMYMYIYMYMYVYEYMHTNTQVYMHIYMQIHCQCVGERYLEGKEAPCMYSPFSNKCTRLFCWHVGFFCAKMGLGGGDVKFCKLFTKKLRTCAYFREEIVRYLCIVRIKAGPFLCVLCMLIQTLSHAGTHTTHTHTRLYVTFLLFVQNIFGVCRWKSLVKKKTTHVTQMNDSRHA